MDSAPITTVAPLLTNLSTPILMSSTTLKSSTFTHFPFSGSKFGKSQIKIQLCRDAGPQSHNLPLSPSLALYSLLQPLNIVQLFESTFSKTSGYRLMLFASNALSPFLHFSLIYTYSPNFKLYISIHLFNKHLRVNLIANFTVQTKNKHISE